MNIQLSKMRKYIAGFGLLVAVSLVGVAITTTSFAQTDGDATTANSLKVSPLRTDISADPGETKVVKITIGNPTSSAVSVRPVQNDFVADGEDGTPALILEESEYASSHSLKQFLQPLDSFTLEGGESKTIEATIVVPENAEAGGYFGAVRFMPTSPDEGGQVNLSASVASLILLTVNGDAPEKLTLTDFTVQQQGRSATFFTTGDNMSISIRFKNEGNLQAGPFGNISVTKGGEVLYQTEFNNSDPRGMVLPDSARRWSESIENISGFGKYTVSAVFTYGSNNQTIEVTKSFWVIPLPIIISAIAILILIIGAIIGLVLYRRRRKNNMSLSGSKRR